MEHVESVSSDTALSFKERFAKHHDWWSVLKNAVQRQKDQMSDAVKILNRYRERYSSNAFRHDFDQ